MSSSLSVRAPRGSADGDRIAWGLSAPFFALHLSPLLLIWVDLEARHIWLAVGLYFARIFFITAGFHRYFSHRSYKMNRGMQFAMAFLGQTCIQKGTLWWASHHRLHHKHSDEIADAHSPKDGFWWSHVGWILCHKYQGTEWDRIRDFAKFPELVWLNKWHAFPGIVAMVVCFLVGGLPALTAFLLSTIAVYHGTFTINSVAHVFGSRRYVTKDTSRNSLIFALLTLGEGWHNNHHYYQSAARQGFFWWEIDITWYLLKLMSWLGLVRDLRQPSQEVLARNRVKDNVDVGMLAPTAEAS